MIEAVMHPRAWSRLLQPGTTIVSGGAVSPAGRHLAFVARDEHTGKTTLWIRAVDAVEPLMLPDTEGASNPFFSPDGQRVAFFRSGRLVAAEVTGKQQRTIAPVGGAPAGGSWGADDVIVFAEWMTGLFAVASTGGPVSPLTRLDHTALDVAHAWPQFLPDGRRFLYHVVSPDNTRAGVYVSSLDSRASTRLLDDAAAAIYVAPGFLLYSGGLRPPLSGVGTRRGRCRTAAGDSRSGERTSASCSICHPIGR